MEQTLYFKNGILYKIDPNDGRNYYQARFFISDGEKYDFENKEVLKGYQFQIFQDKMVHSQM